MIISLLIVVGHESGTGSFWLSEIPQRKKSCPRLSWFYVPKYKNFLVYEMFS